MDKTLSSGLILVVVASLCFAAVLYGPGVLQQASVAPSGWLPGAGSNTYMYNSNMLASYSISDSATATALTTGVVPQFFSSTANPFGLSSADMALPYTTSYSSSVNAWQSTVSSGAYNMVIGAAATYYPTIAQVSISGTNQTNLNGQPATIINPAAFSMIQRATPGLTATVKAFNATSGLYDISASNVSTTTYNKWQITYSISASGVLGQQLKAGTLYMPIIQGLTINGATSSWSTAPGQAVTVTQDVTGLTTGLSGYAVAVPSITAGNTYTLTVYLQEAGTITGLPVAFNTVYHDASDINNPSYRWWVDTSLSTIYVDTA